MIQKQCLDSSSGVSDTRPARGSNAAREYQKKMKNFRTFHTLIFMWPSSHFEFETPALVDNVNNHSK